MFSGIAPRYDLLNHVLSLNIDKRWRRQVAERLGDILERPEASILDVACGTGDLSLELGKKTNAQIVGTDFCHPMLMRAKAKSQGTTRPIPLVEGDALALPFEDNSFDAATIAFGLRNLANLQSGITELGRILKNEGRLVILEFSHPVIPGFGRLFDLYFSKILPKIGGAVSGSYSAYEYLPNSVSRFPNQQELAAEIESAGFTSVSYTNLTGGIAALHSGTKAI